jgi:hypothetical protein
MKPPPRRLSAAPKKLRGLVNAVLRKVARAEAGGNVGAPADYLARLGGALADEEARADVDEQLRVRGEARRHVERARQRHERVARAARRRSLRRVRLDGGRRGGEL